MSERSSANFYSWIHFERARQKTHGNLQALSALGRQNPGGRPAAVSRDDHQSLAQAITIIDLRVPRQRAPRNEMVSGAATDLFDELTQ